jgi:hypothetical protein
MLSYAICKTYTFSTAFREHLEWLTTRESVD